VAEKNQNKYLIPASIFQLFKSKFLFCSKFLLKIFFFYSFLFPPGKYQQITATLN